MIAGSNRVIRCSFVVGLHVNLVYVHVCLILDRWPSNQVIPHQSATQSRMLASFPRHVRSTTAINCLPPGIYTLAVSPQLFSASNLKPPRRH